MRFVKYHGLGNDFIVLEEPAPPVTPELARRLCRRGFSIGADGVMRLAPPTSRGAHVTMDLVNSDGSLPEMCGNGIRCLVKHAVDALGMSANPLMVDTPNGILACAWTRDATGVTSVRVAMGRPRFATSEVPVDLAHTRPADHGQLTVTVADRAFTGLPVNTGNPHFVVFGETSRELALTWGPPLETHPAFPERANIELVEVLAHGGPGEDPHLRVFVWERGCGLTYACGTGATASTAAAIRLGHISGDGRPAQVDLPGGTLTITIEPDFSGAFMEGPVERAYRGELAP